MAKGMLYHRRTKMWMRPLSGDTTHSYFNIQTWKFVDFKGEARPEDFCTLHELQESVAK